MMDHPLTLAETFELLGIPHNPGTFKNMAKRIDSKSTGELDWGYTRTRVREDVCGHPELVIIIPFSIKTDAIEEG